MVLKGAFFSGAKYLPATAKVGANSIKWLTNLLNPNSALYKLLFGTISAGGDFKDIGDLDSISYSDFNFGEEGYPAIEIKRGNKISSNIEFINEDGSRNKNGRILREDEIPEEWKALSDKLIEYGISSIMLSNSRMREMGDTGYGFDGAYSSDLDTIFLDTSMGVKKGEEIAIHEYGHSIFEGINQAFGDGFAEDLIR